MVDQKTPAPVGTSVPTLGQRLSRRKPVEKLVAETESGTGLRRTMGFWQLSMIGIGATLGTGIFVVLGEAVPVAGPAVILAFVLAGVTALFSALAYAEMAGMIPASGSAYSYSYATMGEFMAWVCGWCLMLTYGVSVAAVGVGWGQYINELLELTTGLALPGAFLAGPLEGGLVNLPAAVVVLLSMFALLAGVRESTRANAVMVAIKIAVLVMFVAIAITAVQDGNFAPFMPMGMAGVSAAGATLFFSYIGFDSASTASEEAKNPQRDLPRAIMFSMIVVTAIYCLVAFSAIGALNWTEFAAGRTSLAGILTAVTGTPVWAVIFAAGAVLALASVVLVVLYSQTRILFAMSRDGLIPKAFSEVDAKGTPRANTVITSVSIAVLAALIPLGPLADATAIGTLFAFALVNVAVLVLRRNRPDLKRAFRMPGAPVTPVLGVLACAYLMISMPLSVWVAFGAWLVVGLAVYFGYGMRRSALEAEPAAEVRA
ncbi:amino acid transporter [Nocardiopsis terrae]|uniref:APA family basic amino acid/polyamine antiporter n=1 Tax=Nocardiopsis terrae TaxID=372655 RepID=A0ABR9HCI7_9ACTN|nr:amino acid permease [Nocardiopsis terrae]MBE1456736.1 APA family basic amino acid/polyamine antiporter [Nocardiopsis terrae]GHC75369.1 amino acid transporter [Nocardiopsis terrae]